MLHNADVRRWMTFVICGVLLIQNALAASQYPDLDSVTGFRAGDTIQISWTLAFTGPNLELYGGYNEKRK